MNEAELREMREFKKLTNKEMLVSLKYDSMNINKAVNGNGSPGLLQRMQSIERWKYTISGGLIILGAALGFNLGGLI